MLLGGDAGYYYSTPGLDGSVWLSTLPAVYAIADVSTDWDGKALSWNVSCANPATATQRPERDIGPPNDGLQTMLLKPASSIDCGSVRVTLLDGDTSVAEGTGAAGTLEVRAPKLWWPIGSAHGRPFLYTLRVQTSTDSYRLKVGLRTVAAVGREIQVNGKKVYLRGVDHHIDGHLRGHGVDRVLHAMDMALMRTTNLNAFRVNSWAVPEQLLDLCDELGFLVQSEVPAIALRQGWDPKCAKDIFAPGGNCANASTLASHKKVFAELFERDKNRASVISFSLSNEPEDGGASAESIAYFKSVMASARALAKGRLLTVEGVSDMKFYQEVDTDIISVHSYPGWYDYAPLNEVQNEMSAFLATWSAAFPTKPLVVSEYGAGAIPGHHTLSSLQFTEESQVAILEADHAAFEPFRLNGSLAGEHVHAWSDFEQTGSTVAQSQSGGARGMLLDIDGLNFKGLFSRSREPKAAAALMQRRYAMIAQAENKLKTDDAVADEAAWTIAPAHTAAPLRKVSPAFISFALDNAFVRTDCRPADPTSNKHGNSSCLPDDATNSTRIDFQNGLLKKVMPLTAGGYIRIGGTYTDFIHYEVEGNNYTRCPYHNMTAAGAECPGNSFPCCLPMPMARWREALQFGHDTGMQITFNLNILHGRWDDYTATIKCRRKKNCPPLPPSGYRPRWDSSNARALMEYTKSLPKELWPARFGLGNELNWYIPPQQWAEDMIEMSTMLKEVFGAASSIATYGPCNAGLLGTWSSEFLGNISERGPSALGAFSFHGYQHSRPTSANIAQFPGIDASRDFFESVYQQDWKKGSAAPNKDAELWITETAWTAQAPANAAAGGPQATLNGMETAADMAWNLDALGAAAEVGVDVFCRETLAGDWLEVLGLWQPRDQQPYTPHADFIVAAMWRKLMAVEVLGTTNATTAVTSPALVSRGLDGEGWKTFPGFSSSFRKCPLNGSALFPYLGTVDSVADCEAKCAARRGCQSWSWDSSKPGMGAPGWGHRCYGQMNEQFHLDAVGSVTAGCHPSSPYCKMPPPPPRPTAIRPYAHCSRATPGSVVFAISAAPCVRSPTERITLRFPGAQSLTSYWLSARAITANIIALNGQNLTFTADGPLPSLEGAVSSGDSVVMPSGGVCTVGFVEVKYAKPVLACKTDDNVAAAPAPAPIKVGLPWPQGTG